MPQKIFLFTVGGNSRHWGYVLRGLNKHNYLFSVQDYPSCSFWAHSGFPTIREYAWHVIEHLDGVGQVILFGYSMGGAIALELCHLLPGRVAGIILMACGLDFPKATDVLKALKDKNYWLIANLLYGPDADPFSVKRAETDLASIPIERLERDYSAAASWSISPEKLMEITIPCCIICGGRDGIVPIGSTYQLHRYIERSKMIVIPQAGHLLLFESP